MEISTSSVKQWIWHVGYWILAALFLSFFYGFRRSGIEITFWFVILLLPIAIATAYFFNYFLIPRYLFRKRYFLFVLYSVYTLVFSVYLEFAVLIFIFIVITGLDFNSARFEPLFLLSGMYIPVSLAVLVKLYNNWSMSEEERRLLTQQKAEAELKLLKAQLHPHFLFNTLNNLYALAIEKSDKVPEMILKLADLLHFILYESGSDKIPIDKEIEQVRNYMELEKLRFDESCEIDLQIIGNTDNIKILPLSILTLVENSFKHGIQKSLKSKWLKVKVSVDRGKISISISNSMNSVPENVLSEGIGLLNLRSRLNLIYKEKFKLEILPGKSEFNVLLLLG